MDNKWQKVREIFDATIRRQPEERSKFVIEACGDDKTLLAEVESLLSSLDGAESFMETPAVATVADLIQAETKKLETGKCFGHYEVIEQIGAGGMGEVYLAQDNKLDRKVAVKILNKEFSQDESNLRRFIQEAKAASALNHPNILVIHEIGEADDANYIVSELIKGKTLREILKQSTLKLSEILDISIQIASALSAAHESFLIHRDIKPENIMIRPDGFVKVLDFGLAKLVNRKNKSVLRLEDETVAQNQTAKGVILGTVNYMSPEQAKGEQVDERTDIFSLGIVIYEIISGRTPFVRDSLSETFADLINKEPPPLSDFAPKIPEETQRVISKMLSKNKNERQQTMKDVLADLKALKENQTLDEKLGRAGRRNGRATEILKAATGDAVRKTAATQNIIWRQIKHYKSVATLVLIFLLFGTVNLGYWFFAGRATMTKQIESIAVLPLENLSGDASQEYFTEGMTDTLITELIKVGNLRVISRNSTMQFKGTRKSISEIARELDVDAIVEGTALRSDDKVLISVQLFRAEDEQNLWAESYERGLGDVPGLQREVARGIAGSIKVKINLPEQADATKQMTIKPEAQNALFRGRYYFYKAINAGSVEERIDSHKKGIDYYEQAISLEPNFAEAYAALATSYYWLARDWINPNENFPKSIEAANRAIQIDENNALAHNALAYCAWNYRWDAATAEREHKRVFELDSGATKIASDQGHHGYAVFLSQIGRYDEAIEEIKLAEKNDPLNIPLKNDIGYIYIKARQYDIALEQFQRILETEPNFHSLGISYCLALKGMYKEALAERKKILEVTKTPLENSPELAWSYAFAGERGKAVKILEAYRKLPEDQQSFWNIANIYAALGDKDQVLFWLEKSIQRHEIGLRNLKTRPEFDIVRDDPRFQDLLRRAGFPS